jgi:hypothetical protein
MRVQRRPTSTTGLHATGLCAVRPRVAMDEMLRRSKCGRSVEPRHRRLWFYWRWPARMQLAMEFAGGVGGEADLLYTGLNGSRDVFAPGASASEDFRSRWLATFRGRIGWLVARNMNFYATGGLALATVNTDSTVNLKRNHQQLVRLNNTCRMDAEWRFGMDVRRPVVGQSRISVCRSRSRQQRIAAPRATH